MLEVIPAVDIKAGRCVRLLQGDMATETVYFEDPVQAARFWQDQGARRLHIVDLDGAVCGRPVNRELVVRIAREVTIPIQVGGGIRTSDDIERYFSAGLDRVIVGTAAYENAKLLEDIAPRYPGKVFVGIDARDGLVAVEGWTRLTPQKPAEILRPLQTLPLGGIIYTDIRRDGMLCGVNVQAIGALLRSVSLPVIASGGVATKKDLYALASLNEQNLIGVIIGKALYTGAITLAEAHAAAGISAVV